ncbi:helix-turn-helix transcriptional regulator [Pontibacter sp. HSC-14F20]|nr:helix-turn-helix transcriptional regulator [Pontibacter sp. HSC-14F20]MBX0334094.1 helix-turn-helix transcriptional regulator [Pontibacter sp. HSC-14F20]
METAARKRPIHLGDHVRRMRTALGVKQAALASELGTTQQNISRIEQEEEVDDATLEKIANVLGVPAEAIRNFTEEGAVFHIQNMQDHASAGNFNQCSFNPLDKLMEVVDENKKLYERILLAEREKVELLERMLKNQNL